jgi:hypothetical protein
MQLGNRLHGTSGLPCLEQGTDLGYPQPGKRLPQPGGRSLWSANLVGEEQIVPGGNWIILPEISLAPFRKRPCQLLEQLIGALVPVDGRLTEKAMRLLKPAILEGLLCLPDCQPSKSEHG